MRISRRAWFWVGIAVVGVACDLNPQPDLPLHDANGGQGGTNGSAGAGPIIAPGGTTSSGGGDPVGSGGAGGAGMGTAGMDSAPGGAGGDSGGDAGQGGEGGV